MSDEKLRRLIDERAKLWGEIQDIRERAEKAVGEDAVEVDTALRNALDAIEAKDAEVETEQRVVRMEKLEIPDPMPVESKRTEDDVDAYAEAFGAMLRRGAGSLTPEQRSVLQSGFSEVRAQGAGTDSAGGYTVPDVFLAQMTETMKAYGGLLSVVDVINTATGQDMSWPSNDDTSNTGAILAENTQITGDADVTFGTVPLSAYMYTSKIIKVSFQLLQDSAFNLNAWLPGKIAERIGRAVAAHIANGSGSSQPKGVSKVTVGVNGAKSATAKITYDDLVDLEHSVDPAYRTNARYAFHDSALALIRKMKDDNGRPLWVPSLAPGVPSTINGRPYTVDNGLPEPAASAASVFFGDFKAAYTARQVAGAQVLRLTERYADYLQVGFLGFQRWGGTIDDTSAVKSFKHGAAA